MSERTEQVRTFVQGRVRVVDSDLASGLEAVGPGHEHVVLVAQEGDGDLARSHEAVLASLGHPVAIVLLPHGPGAVLWIAMNVAAANLGPGRSPALAAGLAKRIWSGGCVQKTRQVKGLSAPFTAHVRSMLPGGSFVVQLSPELRLCPGPPDMSCQGGWLTVLGRSPSTEVVSSVASRLGVAQTSSAGDLGLGLGCYGGGDVVELVGISADLSVPLPTWLGPTCPACGSEVIHQYCAFCHTRPAVPAAELQGVVQ